MLIRKGSNVRLLHFCGNTPTDVGRADDLAPLVDVFGNKFAEVADELAKAVATSKPILDLRIGKRRVYFTMKAVEDGGRSVPGRDNAVPAIPS